jgi:hypothetical protein
MIMRCLRSSLSGSRTSRDVHSVGPPLHAAHLDERSAVDRPPSEPGRSRASRLRGPRARRWELRIEVDPYVLRRVARWPPRPCMPRRMTARRGPPPRVNPERPLPFGAGASLAILYTRTTTPVTIFPRDVMGTGLTLLLQSGLSLLGARRFSVGAFGAFETGLGYQNFDGEHGPSGVPLTPRTRRAGRAPGPWGRVGCGGCT